MPAGDVNTPGSVVIGAPGNDVEDGITFVSPLVPGNKATISVTAHNATGVPAVLQGWIDFNGNGLFEAGEQLTSLDFAPTGLVVPNGGLTNQLVCFTVPANASFTGGAAFSRFRLSTAGGLNFDGAAPIGEVEDYKRFFSRRPQDAR